MKRANLIIILLSFLFFLSTAALATTNNTPADASSVDWVGWIKTGLLALGLVLLGWYQKYKIGILTTEIKSQKSIISSLEKYHKIMDIEKIEKFVGFAETTIQKMKELEIKEIQSDFSEKINLVESEREKLLVKIDQSKETVDRLKSSYKALTKNSTDRIIFAVNYRTLVLNYEVLSSVTDYLIMYALLLFRLNNIKHEKFHAVSKETEKLKETFDGMLALFDETNLSEINESLQGHDELKNFDNRKYFLKTVNLQESIRSEIKRVIAENKPKP